MRRATKPIPIEQDHRRDDLAAGRRRVDVRPQRGHRRQRPVDPLPEVEVLFLLEGGEAGAAGDDRQGGEQQRVADPLQREDLAREFGQAQEAEQPQQPQGPQSLQPRRQDRRRQEHDHQIQRVVPQPGLLVGHHTQHHHQLDQEGEPGDPVQSDGDRLQRPARFRLRDRHRRHRQCRRDQHRRIQLFADANAALVHPRLLRRGEAGASSGATTGPRNDKTRREAGRV